MLQKDHKGNHDKYQLDIVREEGSVLTGTSIDRQGQSLNQEPISL